MLRAAKNPEPTAEDPGDSYNNAPEEPLDVGSAPKPDPVTGWTAQEGNIGLTLAGVALVNGTHKVTISFFAPTPGAQLVALGTNEARLLARSILDWANYVDDLADGKKA